MSKYYDQDCRCSKTASVLILCLFLRVKILNLAHHKFTFFLFTSNNSCLFSHFNDATFAITKNQIAETSPHDWHSTLNKRLAGQTHPQRSMLRKVIVGTSLNKKVACNVMFSSVKQSSISTWKKKTYLKKFFSKRNWEQMKKLDLFCKNLSVNQVKSDW